jgi:2-oxo-hept-3-ene-1,7-dioate hydratase
MHQALRTEAAQSLIRAERDKKPVVQLSKTWPEITLEDAYAIQALVNEMKVAQGSKTIGNKIGLTSKAMQQSSRLRRAARLHDDRGRR